MSDDATLIYVDADGNEVPEGDPRAVKQYRSDDEARPTVKTKTSKSKAAADAAADDEPETDDGAEAKAKTTPPEDKAVKAPKATKARTAPAESK